MNEELNKQSETAGGCNAQFMPTPLFRGIGWAVKQMWNGQRVQREGWNGRGMWLALQVPDNYSKMTEKYVYMRTAQGGLIPWLCSQADLLATDWGFFEERE